MGTFATRVLRRAGFDTVHVSSGEDALGLLSGDGPWHGLLAAAQLPGMSGAELTAVVREAHPNLPIAVVTGYLSAEQSGELERGGADVVLVRPLTPAGLVTEMRELLGAPRSRRTVDPA